MSAFRLVVISSKPPKEILRLLNQLQREVPAARICGVLYHEQARKPIVQRLRAKFGKLLQPGYAEYEARRALRRVLTWLTIPRNAAIRFLHAYRRNVLPPPEISLAHLGKHIEQEGGELFVVADLHSPQALAFLGRQKADLAVVFGTGLLKRSLFGIPRLGSVNLHKRKLPDYRGGGAVGLWELLDDCNEIGVTVHQVEDSLDSGAVLRAATIPIGPYDNLESLALKAAVVGGDLICGAISDVIQGKVQATPQTAPGKLYRAPTKTQWLAYQKELRRRRPKYEAERMRSTWNLLARSILLLPFVLIRNWFYRWNEAFPVIIFYHHVITDRPHHLGMPTAEFVRQLDFLGKFYRVVSLEQAMQMLHKGKVPAPTVVLTFDDGYADNFINLRAAIEHSGTPVSLFLSTGHISSGAPFDHDVKRGQMGFEPLSWDQVTSLHRAGFSFGCHTRNHFDCGSTNLRDLEEEIEGSRSELISRAGIWTHYFSFPWGMPKNMSKDGQRLAKACFKYIFLAAGGVNRVGVEPEGAMLCRISHPTSLWEVELALQCSLDIRWRDIFPYFFLSSS